MERIYLDNAATTPMHPKVIEKMMEVMNSTYGNPSSIHSFGREVTSSARFSTGNDWQPVLAQKKRRLFLQAVERKQIIWHCLVWQKAIRKTESILSRLQLNTMPFYMHVKNSKKWVLRSLIYLLMKPGEFRLIDFRSALRDDTILVSIMYGNNEVGTLQPITEIGQLLKDHQAIFHTDAVQAYGVEKIDVNESLH